MYLKSLEISGFKSFGKKAELHFTSPISAIVGPNGSGKSNVAEAFRFVLGEQSLKSMRGKRGEDLIFNGSEGIAATPRQNRAQVKLVFDNSRRSLPIDFEEVSLERVVHRDGINEYFLNGSQVRLKDIVELLSHAHIGASGHHIISQGEADRILSANLKERRAMLEDALGLKIFQYKKLESERKLEKTEENVKQVESLRREIAPHLKFLQKQVEKVEKARSLRDELRVVYKEYLKREEIYLKNALNGIATELSPLEEELDSIKATLESIKKSLQNDGKDKLKSELIELQEKQRQVISHVQNLTHELGRIEGEIAAEKRLEERNNRRAGEELEVKVSLKEVEEKARESFHLFEKAENENSLDLFRSAFGTLRDLWNNFVNDRRERKVGNEDFVATVKALEEKKIKLEDEKNRLENDITVVAEKAGNLEDEIKKSEQGNIESEREMFRLMNRQSELQAKIVQLREKRNNISLEEEEWKRELGEACMMLGREMMDYGVGEVVDDANRASQIERRRQVEKMKIRLEELGLSNSEELMKEYQETEERDAFLLRELGDLGKAEEDLKQMIKELDLRINNEFENGIEKINREFQKYFELLFGGGKAALKVILEKKRKDEEMEESEEVENEAGIDIQVDLPKKKIKALMMLSGGERALTSIALLFAMTSVNPPPFIILDETDAALDEANSRKYGDMVENLAKYSQLIVITHNRETMSRAGVIYGVTMISGLSKLLSIKFDEAVVVAK